MFLVQKSIQNLFLEFLSIFSLSWTKSGKKHVFCNFLKNTDFWSKFNITNVFLVKFPFYKCILLCTLINSFKSYVQYKIRQK